MPTPLSTPGAPIIPVNINSPAAFGLNTEEAGSILSPEWAIVLDNAVFDSSGRPASRKGFLSLTSSAGSGIIMRVFEYFKADGTSQVIYSSDSDIYKDTNSATSIEGAMAISEGNIKFANFNDKLIAFGIGTSGLPAVRTTGDFVDVTINSQSPGATDPAGTIGTAAFGRVWIVDPDGKTIRYSALLDETRWATADGGGLIDFSKVWPAGQDSIIAIQEFMGDMVVFGSNNTVIMTDGQGSSLGIDPTNMYVSDTIPGQGALSQFGIARAAGDLWVITASGIVGLRRELSQKTTPITNLSQHIQSEVLAAIDAETDIDDITLEYSPKEALVIAVFPTTNRQYVFDTRRIMEDGTNRATTWTSDLQTISYIRDSQDLLGSLTGVTGEVMEYTGHTDDGATFIFNYESGWLDLGEELNTFLKFVKRITSFVFIEKNITITYKLSFDFGLTSFTMQVAGSGGRAAEYNTAEYGDNGKYDVTDDSAVAGTDVAEWSGSVALRTLDAPAKGSGQYLKVGLSLDTNSGAFSLQQLNLYMKIGRHAT